MSKFFIILSIFFLIVVTAVTKNSTKRLEDKIFLVKEDINVLKEKFELVLLDYNFLTTPKKLLEYQSKYFEKDLIPIDINEVKKITKINDKLVITEFNKIENEQ
tara:strand:- start:985 stop:1296 length:312 start_codon:yes stop_codon:yes gene_type:complete